MFGFFKKNPAGKMKKEYVALLEKARDAQRSGDIKGYAKLVEQSEALLRKIEELENDKST